MTEFGVALGTIVLVTIVWLILRLVGLRLDTKKEIATMYAQEEAKKVTLTVEVEGPISDGGYRSVRRIATVEADGMDIRAVNWMSVSWKLVHAAIDEFEEPIVSTTEIEDEEEKVI